MNELIDLLLYSASESSRVFIGQREETVYSLAFIPTNDTAVMKKPITVPILVTNYYLFALIIIKRHDQAQFLTRKVINRKQIIAILRVFESALAKAIR